MAQAQGSTLAMLLVGEIPAGLRVLDALAKEAEIAVVQTGTIHCGRYLILFGGEMGPVERSWVRAKEIAGTALLDDVLLPDAEERLASAIGAGAIRWPAEGDTLAVLETATPPLLLAALDAALKGAHVELVELRVGDGLGGKAIASLWGETHDVEAAVDIAAMVFARRGAGAASTAIIPRAAEAVRSALGVPSRFFKEFRG